MRSTILAVLVLIASFTAAAGPIFDDPKSAATAPSLSPQSPAVVAAQQKHDAAVKKAKAAYQQAVIAADKQMVGDLTVALDAAMASKNVDEVKRIDAAKTQAIRELQAVDKGTITAGEEIAFTAGAYHYRWGREMRELDLQPDGTISTGSNHYPGFGKNERRWAATPVGVTFTGESGGVELFYCRDGNYRGTGGGDTSVVLSAAK